MNKIIFLVLCTFIASTTFSLEGKNNEKKAACISSHFEYAKGSIEQKTKELKKKIKKLEKQLSDLDKIDNQDDHENDKKREKTLNKIQKYQVKIDALKTINSSLNAIDFNNL